MFLAFRASLAAAGLAALLTACADQPTAHILPGTDFLAKGGPQPAVPLAVTVEDTGYAVQSDGGGEYIDGTGDLVVELDGPGNLQFSPVNASESTPPSRTLGVDYSTPTDPLNSYRPDPSAQHNFKIKTGNAGLPRIQDLGTGTNPTSACYPVTIAHQGGSVLTHHRAIFNPPAASGSTYGRVARVSATEWTMVSDGSCTGAANVAGVWSQDLSGRKAGPLVFRGNYVLRFSLRLRSL